MKRIWDEIVQWIAAVAVASIILLFFMIGGAILTTVTIVTVVALLIAILYNLLVSPFVRAKRGTNERDEEDSDGKDEHPF